jgi:hypothetical protein
LKYVSFCPKQRSLTHCQLFNGGESNWQVHLGAAAELILLIHGIDAPAAAESKSSGPETSESLSQPSASGLHFFTSAIIWFDILACISTGAKPYLAEHHNYLISSPHLAPADVEDGGKIQLHNIMGCQNWTMSIIGEIAYLGASDSARYGDTADFDQTVQDIKQRLERQSSHVRDELRDLNTQHSGTPPHYLSDVYDHYVILVVTNIFASAAIIYLQTIIELHPTAAYVHDHLCEFMTAMTVLPDPRMIRGLVWPLCVAGCMASPPDQDFFRIAANGAITDARTFGNSGKALELLEKAWEMQREEGRLIDCAACIRRSGSCLLLV